MQKRLLFAFATFASTLFFIQTLMAQNTSPYWSLAGNSNASNTTSKLGTTNAINLRLFTNNVERVRILSTNGNVGIGTTAPTDRLHLNTPTGTNALRAQINGNTKLLVHSNGGVAVGANSTPPTNGMYVSGNTGIGTTAPATKLHVVGTSLFTDNIAINEGGLKVNHSGGIGIHTAGDIEGMYAVGNIGVRAIGITHGVYCSGTSYGVYGSSSSNYGVYGTGKYGVWGEGTSQGVSGSSTNGRGVQGSSTNNLGAYFESFSYNALEARTFNGTYAGVFYGPVYSSAGYATSDRNVKQNFVNFEGAMRIIAKLKPQYYEFKTDEKYRFLNLPKGGHYGLIAQDIEEVLPGLVAKGEHEVLPVTNFEGHVHADEWASPREKLTVKALNYTELIPIMIKGMQEQEAEIRAKDEKIADLETRLQKVEAMLNGSNYNITSISGSLEQNIPNPAGGTTTIGYHIPQTYSTATLTLTNAKGQVVKTILLSNSGSGRVTLDTKALAAGVYQYTLYVDGKVADTKRFVITR